MKWLLLSFLLISAAQNSLAEIKESRDLNDVITLVNELHLSYKPDEILVIYDVDTTLLSSPLTLWSDQWVLWQSELLNTKNPTEKQFLVANEYQAFFKLYWKFLPLVRMEPTQRDAAEIQRRLSKMGLRQIILTSRSPFNRNETEAQLIENGFVFWNPDAEHTILERMAFDPKNLSAHCLNEDLLTQLNVQKPKIISVGKNQIFTQGQHKGMVLRTVLCQSKKKYKAIVYADDLRKNGEAVEQALKGFPGLESLNILRYGRKDGLVLAFEKADKSIYHQQWVNLQKQLNEIFK